MSEAIQIDVRFFAILRESAGTSQASLLLPAGATVADAADAIGKRFPGAAAYLSRLAYAVNRAYVPTSTPLNNGDELALIPPVSGGIDG